MKKLMAANWKMYKTWAEAESTARELVGLAADKLPADREVLVFPPFTALKAVGDAFAPVDGFSAGGQDFYTEEEGAFTGEISPKMLADAGASYGLTGHSERRHVLGESDELVGRKTAYGLEKGLKVILCVGEKIEERKGGKVEEVLERQIRAGLRDVPVGVEPDRISVAYEPVWAIGTGEVAGPAEIQQAHGFTRKILVSIYGEKANEMRILYGGSVKPGNCAEIIALDNVDGVLVGGASLLSESFSQIVLA
ncbi:triose-phosphate isomerase [Pseudodesulfovibrio indicus]|uniref:Triosephosphate isomerase n=1 Tax=Pseudodesulfovibrio indicus TaxID=1716143 RepID=A0A126QP82_9BACT|nr:triose-phosphate isomerase [Pseudodesulfovibrio indicus]AMK11802.1 triose-phosphate isomerase [Pseudodesulfovibrio indicus]TDT88344.1 triosephosphate isomerase [Pseudodesulfovibrio indicus]